MTASQRATPHGSVETDTTHAILRRAFALLGHLDDLLEKALSTVAEALEPAGKGKAEGAVKGLRKLIHPWHWLEIEN